MAAESWRCPEPLCRDLVEADTPEQLQEAVKVHQRGHTAEDAADAAEVVGEAAASGFFGGLIRAIGKLMD